LINITNQAINERESVDHVDANACITVEELNGTAIIKASGFISFMKLI